MPIKFGPSGLGSVKEAIPNLEKYHKLGLKACEIAFTYGPYIKDEKEAKEIGKKAEELGIYLSIHAPYWINLNSLDKTKIEQSKERILRCLEVGTWLGVKRIIFHAGFYGKMSREDTYKNIKNAILDLQKIRKERKYTPELAPETMGKVNVFGSVEEISKLVQDTKCSFCIDFAHILAREKNYKFQETLKAFKDFKEMHIHFSGIVYGDKGEKHHKETEKEEWKKIISNLPKNKEIFIINEAPNPIKDSVAGLHIYMKGDKKVT
ncbi:TIM barrel protein [Candidatus Pacearchaeota archaeon]|nr:TIM barrel protein [Candidatus Pacearchaeota archaeon]